MKYAIQTYNTKQLADALTHWRAVVPEIAAAVLYNGQLSRTVQLLMRFVFTPLSMNPFARLCLAVYLTIYLCVCDGV